MKGIFYERCSRWHQGSAYTQHGPGTLADSALFMTLDQLQSQKQKWTQWLDIDECLTRDCIFVHGFPQTAWTAAFTILSSYCTCRLVTVRYPISLVRLCFSFHVS
ncbi:hypothetical protein VFPPC_18085 [Pochonia chlamydosporia 170]|uniref:Uncharacterized protein n=1 Tax=Pochonia chlamydosporia 170 TaxID=1380566 RepID=A0A219AQ29_METCM|nr:hypothetical protein VFPPC_18085 [Pochonia chlamydosporia 170]OWT42672.1 hypothetical protein VFPPC_18085 [Pochonia chlamydosporia 170]